MQRRSNECRYYSRNILWTHAFWCTCTQRRNGSFCVVNAPRSGKNPGFMHEGRGRRETAVGQLAARATNLWGLLQTWTAMISYTLWHVTNCMPRTMRWTRGCWSVQDRERGSANYPFHNCLLGYLEILFPLVYCRAYPVYCTIQNYRCCVLKRKKVGSIHWIKNMLEIRKTFETIRTEYMRVPYDAMNNNPKQRIFV